jgi:hypothetical protein
MEPHYRYIGGAIALRVIRSPDELELVHLAGGGMSGVNSTVIYCFSGAWPKAIVDRGRVREPHVTGLAVGSNSALRNQG